MKDLDVFLSNSAEKLALPTENVEMKRLSKSYNQTIEFELRAVSYSQYKDIQEKGVKKNAKNPTDVDYNEIQTWLVLNGVVWPNFADKQLQEKLGAATKKDCMEKMLLPGEVAMLAEKIIELSGFNEDKIEQAKN